jgi:hypothetical protein
MKGQAAQLRKRISELSLALRRCPLVWEVALSSIDDLVMDPTFNKDWHMKLGERVALLYLLQNCHPDLSIEIGTFRCGSLRPIAKYSRSVFTFDIDANQHRVASLFPSVRFITGDTAATLPPIIAEINKSGRELNFVLVDGSHEEEGVRADITNILDYVPRRSPSFILMHDSSNPVVRRGIEAAPWHQCPYVHGVDLDLVPGMLYDRPDIHGQIWGGLALAVLLPKQRTGDLVMNRGFGYSLQALLAASAMDATVDVSGGPPSP